jgi:parvulin-like peptidyl-prolyl isomerase
MARTAVASSLFFLLACGRHQDLDPSSRIVAEVDGRPVSVADLEAYFHENLVESTPEEPVRFGEVDRVKSRLLDNLLDEELLCAEAERRGIGVTDEEVAKYLETGAAGDPREHPAGFEAREAARREILIHKVRESDARERAQVTRAEVDAYLQSHADELRAKRRIRMRSLRFARAEHASSVKRDLAAKKVDFSRAVELAAGGQGKEEPLSLVLETLPAPVREAVESLEPGEVSEPVTLEGATFLFFVEKDSEAAREGPDTLREFAMEELTAARYDEACAALLRRLRESARIVIHEEKLPFRYVAENPDVTRGDRPAGVRR